MLPMVSIQQCIPKQIGYSFRMNMATNSVRNGQAFRSKMATISGPKWPNVRLGNYCANVCQAYLDEVIAACPAPQKLIHS